MQLTTNMKTHKVLVKVGENLKEFLLSGKEFTKVVQDMNLKKEFIQIEGNLFKRFSIDKIIPLTDLDHKAIAERTGREFITYTISEIAGIHAPTSNVARKFIKIREFLKKKTEGGSKIEEVYSNYGYYTGHKGEIQKIEEKDIILPSKEVTLEKMREFKNNY